MIIIMIMIVIPVVVGALTCKVHSKDGDGRKHQQSIRESYCDRDSKDLHAGICMNPQKGA